ncbi:MAG: hypothetical protein QME81_06915, partial [bacterium]|nr:hypothetical protein [bacterium]
LPVTKRLIVDLARAKHEVCNYRECMLSFSYLSSRGSVYSSGLETSRLYAFHRFAVIKVEVKKRSD